MFAEGVEGVWRVADAETFDAFFVEAAAGEVSAGGCSFAGAELLLKPLGGGFVELDEFGALAMLGGFFGGVEFALGERDAALFGNGADGLGEADVFYFLDEGEDVAGLAAAEAVEELASGMDGEGGCFFGVEGAEAGEVLCSGFFEAHVFADDFDDIGLLLYVLGEVGGHGEWVD